MEGLDDLRDQLAGAVNLQHNVVAAAQAARGYLDLGQTALEGMINIRDNFLTDDEQAVVPEMARSVMVQADSAFGIMKSAKSHAEGSRSVIFRVLATSYKGSAMEARTAATAQVANVAATALLADTAMRAMEQAPGSVSTQQLRDIGDTMKQCDESAVEVVGTGVNLLNAVNQYLEDQGMPPVDFPSGHTQ